MLFWGAKKNHDVSQAGDAADCLALIMHSLHTSYQQD
jgi:hypothetical protein